MRIPVKIPARSDLQIRAISFTAVRKIRVGAMRHMRSGIVTQIRIIVTKIVRTCRRKRLTNLAVFGIVFRSSDELIPFMVSAVTVVVRVLQFR